MFQFIRRISGSVLSRPDREDDASSSAPQIGRKRRLSSSDREDSFKKPRGLEDTVDEVDEDASTSPIVDGVSTPAVVKEVTEGVKDVELEDGSVEVDAEAVNENSSPPPESQPDGDAKEGDKDDPVQKPTSKRGSPRAKKSKSTAAKKSDTTAPLNDTEAPTSKKSSKRSNSSSASKDVPVAAPKKRVTAPRSKRTAKAPDTKEVDGEDVV